MLNPRYNYVDFLEYLGACRDAVEWCRGRDAWKAWEACPDSSWLVWLLELAEDSWGSPIDAPNFDVEAPYWFLHLVERIREDVYHCKHDAEEAKMIQARLREAGFDLASWLLMTMLHRDGEFDHLRSVPSLYRTPALGNGRWEEHWGRRVR